MTRYFPALLLALLAACATTSSTMTEQSILARGTAWETAFNAGDQKSIAALYTEDAVLMPPNEPTVNGRQAIGTYFSPLLTATQKVNIAIKPSETRVTGNMAYRSGAYTLSSSGAVLEEGKFLEVWNRVGNEWLLARDMWSSNNAPPATR